MKLYNIKTRWTLGSELQTKVTACISATPQNSPSKVIHSYRFVSLRCALVENEMLTNLHRLQAMTCTWLVQVAVRPSPSAPLASYAPGQLVAVDLPVTTPPPDTLRQVQLEPPPPASDDVTVAAYVRTLRQGLYQL